MFTALTDLVEVGGFKVRARVEHDEDMREPWKEHDGHGPVSDWTTRDKRPGERVLCSDGRAKRYYDMAEAIVMAKRDGWDAAPYGGTKGEKAARAVEADFERLRQWCNDDWHWVSVVLSVSKGGVMLNRYAASLSGIESDGREYLVDVANELLDEAVEAGRAVVDKVCTCDDAVYVG